MTEIGLQLGCLGEGLHQVRSSVLYICWEMGTWKVDVYHRGVNNRYRYQVHYNVDGNAFRWRDTKGHLVRDSERGVALWDRAAIIEKRTNALIRRACKATT